VTESDQTERKNIFVHPLFLVVATSILGGVGFLLKTYLFLDQSSFRFSIQNIEQYVVLADDPPSHNGSTIYCETFRARLLLAHNGEGKQSVVVHRISTNIHHVEQPTIKPACVVDSLAAKPAGVIGTESMKIHYDGSTTSAILFYSRTQTEHVDPENLLANSESARIITLRPDEEPVSFDIFVSTQVSDLLEVYFEAGYDLEGEKSTRTAKILLAGSDG